jgi:hypothetical protein
MLGAGSQAGERQATAAQPLVKRDEAGGTEQIRLDFRQRFGEWHHRFLLRTFDTGAMPAELGFDRPDDHSDASPEYRVLERPDELAPPDRRSWRWSRPSS